MCTAISEYGLSLVKAGDGILTHCNAGPLATSRYGTGLGPLFLAKERGIPGGFLHVPCCCEQTLEKPGCPSLPLPAITAGLEAAVGAIAESLRKG